MDFDSHKLEALLDLLATSGVEEFEGFGIHVKFTAQVFAPSKVVESAPIPPKPEPTTTWRDERLWPGGKPPEFPK